MARTVSQLEKVIPPDRIDWVKKRLPECLGGGKYDMETGVCELVIKGSVFYRLFGNADYCGELLEFANEAGNLNLILFMYPEQYDEIMKGDQSTEARNKRYLEIKSQTFDDAFDGKHDMERSLQFRFERF